jgi:phospholipase C
MSSNINIQNNLGVTLDVTTTVTPSLDSADWTIEANDAAGGKLTCMYRMHRIEGIDDGHTWIFSSAFDYAGVPVQVQVRLTGTVLSSDIAVQIAASGQRGGWQTHNTDFRLLARTATAII